MSQNEIFGAFVLIRIYFEGTLTELAEKLALALNLTAFDVAPSEYPPHENVGSAEILGWEVWLREDVKSGRGKFLLQMETEHAVDERLHNRMYDLSPWFSRLVTLSCGVETTPIPVKPSGNRGQE